MEIYWGTDQLAVSTLNDRLIFTNKQLGSTYYIMISPSLGLLPDEADAALAALKLDDLDVYLGTDANPSEPRYLPGQYTVDVIAKNAAGTRGGSVTYAFEVIAN